MVFSSEFRMRQYWDDVHQEDALQFTYDSLILWMILQEDMHGILMCDNQ